MKASSAVLAALLALAACDRPPPPSETKGPLPQSPASATVPYGFERKTPDAEVSLRIDQRAGAWPALHQRLYGEGRRELEDFAARAAADRSKLARQGSAIPAYTRQATWAVTAETDRFVSLRQDWADYTGGAHGAFGSETLLWSKGGEQPVLASAVFRPDADYAALDRLLCDAVIAARRERTGDPAAGLMGDCPAWKDSRWVLAPSTVQGRAGGVTFLFDPYVLGAYAEGQYEVVVPQARFRPALAPAFLPEFDGAPRPEPPKG